MTDRAIVAELFRPASGVPRLHALTVIEDHSCTDGGIVRSRRDYDVDWSCSHGCYLFHQSGAGGGEIVEIGGLYHASGPALLKERPSQWVDGKDKPPWRGRRTRVVRKRNRTKRLLRLPTHIDLEPGQDLLEWLEAGSIEQNAVWCSECKDFFPGDYLCEHVWWCSEIGWYSTPTERCGHDREECEA